MIKDLIALEPQSKVWIYQADRFLTYDELDVVRPTIFDFLDDWTSHNQALVTYGNVFHMRFLAFFVDESQTSASGCSIDKSVHFVADLGIRLGIDFFDRKSFCYLNNDEIYTVLSSDMTAAYNNGIIQDDTLIFDNLVTNKKEFLTKWILPLRDSWQYKFIKK